MLITVDGIGLIPVVAAFAVAAWLLVGRRWPRVPVTRRLLACALLVAAFWNVGFTIIQAATTVSAYEISSAWDRVGLAYTLLARHLVPLVLSAVLAMLSRVAIGKPVPQTPEPEEKRGDSLRDLTLVAVVILMWTELASLAALGFSLAGWITGAAVMVTGGGLIVMRDAAVELSTRLAPLWYQRAFPWQFQSWAWLSSGVAAIMFGVMLVFTG